MHLFDTHLHLDRERDAAALFAAARRVGVRDFLVVGCGIDEARTAADVAAGGAGVSAAVGLHPHDAASFDGNTEVYRELAGQPAVVAIGEIGLDYHYNHSPPEVQRDVFRRFLRFGAQVNLPVIIHCREAYPDLLDILREELSPGQPFEVHSFTGTPGQAGRLLEMGAYLSFNGMVTFKKADGIREALAVVPPDRLLLETDSPYLAPVPYRGKPNQPAYLLETAKAVARLRSVELGELARIATANGRRFFGTGD